MKIEFSQENLINAFNKKDIHSIEKILINCPSIIEEVNSSGTPIAMYAASCGDFNILKYIIEYSRASLNIVDENNRNILHYGTESNNLNICKYLVERCGMDILSYDRDLITPYAMATGEVYEYYKEKVGANLDKMYHNPIRTGTFPDPSIIRVDDDYYMVNSSFIFFPCIPISHSKDLINWEVVGHAIVEPSWAELSNLEGGRGYWAPDISYDEGIFYITATYRMNDTGTIYRKQMIVHSNKVEGPYSKPVFINEDGIDPSIFHENGKHYMLLNRGARIFQINPITGEILSTPKMLFYGDNKRAPEGPHLIKKDDYYYLLLAEGGTGINHCITVSRSKTLMGVYEPCPYNPIMVQKDKNATIQRSGHGKFVQTQTGQYYCAYLCVRMVDKKYSLLGRETALDPVNWTADGWPIINNLKGPSALQIKPNLIEHKFNKDNEYTISPLSKNWIFPREPYEDAIKYNGEILHLGSSNEYISSINARNILLQRQVSFSFDFSINIKLIELDDTQELGIIGYYDENTWIALSIFAENNVFYCQLKEKIGIKEVAHKKFIINKQLNSWVNLKMETDFLKRNFYLDDVLINKLDNVYYLCDEGINYGKRFTGPMFGMYVYSNESKIYGEFKGFNYFSK